MTLSRSEEAAGAPTQVSSVSVGAAVDTGVVTSAAFVHVLAASTLLLKVKTRRTHALEAAQCVITRGRSTHGSSLALVFIDTLVPLVVLDVALRTSAAVSSHHVLAAMLTPVVTAALIHIFTLNPCGVQRESFPTFAVEASRCVDARGTRPTHAVLSRALVVVDAGSLVLTEAGRTFAGEAPDGVDTEELTVVLFGGTLVQIFACLPIWLQTVSSGTGAQITALSVLTQEVTRLWRQSTLVHIDAGGGGEVSFVAHVTVTPEGADGVDALAVLTQLWDHEALINIPAVSGVAWSQRAHLLVLDSAGEGAEFALCPPASASVTAAFRLGHAVSVCGRLLAHGLQGLHVTVAFPVVNALGSSGAGLKAVVALTPVTSHSVDTSAVLTNARFGPALVQIHAAFSVRPPLHPRGADAHERAYQILTHHSLGVTVIEALRALVLVSAHAVVFSQDVAGWTHTLIGTKSVDTAESTEQRILGALIYILTGHHRAWFKALVASTLKATNDICACSISTGIPNRALVSVNTFDSSVIQVVSKGTFTAERTICIDANTILADAWIIQTLIHVFTCVSWSRQSTVAEGAQRVEGSFIFLRAQFTGKPPALPWHLTAAAFSLSRVESFRN